jgi:hypothetical protein
MTPEEFSELLRKAGSELKAHAGARLLENGLEIVGLAMENFTGDDLPRIKRGKYAGEPAYSRYNKETKKMERIVTGNSGYMVGPRAINGNLRSSLDARLHAGNNEITVQITAGKKNPVVYAAALEFGMPERNLLPRLYLGRAFQKQLPNVKPDLKDLLRVALNG